MRWVLRAIGALRAEQHLANAGRHNRQQPERDDELEQREPTPC